MTTITANPSYRLDLTSSPHLHSRWSTKQAMWLVIAALIPSVVSALIYFGISQILIIFVCIFFAMGTEALIKFIRKREISILDGSAAITGLLLALILPPGFSPVFAAVGSVVAIGVGKEVFGGLGYNIFNPALVGRAFLQAAFPVQMTTWKINNYNIDSVTTATPLSMLKFDGKSTAFGNLFMGNINGSLGETSALAILIGGIALVIVGVVNYRVPLAMILGLMLFGGVFWLVDPVKFSSPVFHLFAGGFLFGAFFMATDWVTSPITAKGMWIYGLMISLIIIMVRLFGGLPEGVMYAILLMNAFVPLINRYTRPRIFGVKK